ncbi:hypothetical protein AVEN_116142-1 [Araneus ventricosus]|uniref:Uncharacterized protein n=1 Tax=Araneus ventricosus TaxID=182803 RepID=A0A4Y2T2X1_ARAVE|nr:hypothetical protein AVEN_116142-1 [Araneus ventricosus]
MKIDGSRASHKYTLRNNSSRGSRGCYGLVVRSRLWDRRVPGSKLDSTEDHRHVWGLLHIKSCVVAKRPPVGLVWKLGEGVSAQVSSSDRISKLRGPPQNRPRVASKRDVNITKPTAKARLRRSLLGLNVIRWFMALEGKRRVCDAGAERLRLHLVEKGV